ncbi:conserved unknown protein [Ectocarpus siliculosus]|uniref:Uncharacterized protein n=1 Tax=Ectocarpus siliculosus TaxID=2880 RepID=D7FIZ8_ECTSI|nr:conserved unknown protein [Ectocarpus siliculosus]|eukprot:CBJ49037.1 conserved unknown protein [Ectocarpus siliculosus]
MRSSASTPGLSTVGLGKFNIAALHQVIQQPDTNNTTEQCDDFFPGGLGVPDSFQGLDPEENRPPAELFVWGQERARRWDRTEPVHSPTSNPTSKGGDPIASGADPTAGLPGIQRSATAAAGRPFTVTTGMKRRGLATAGGEPPCLGGHRAGGAGGAGRRRSSTEGGVPIANRRNNYSAVRASQGTWQFIARAKSVRETPVSRGDASSLVREFEAAMAVMDNHVGGRAEGHDGAFMSPMQNDIHGLQQEVSRTFDAREAVVEAVEIVDRCVGSAGRAGGGSGGGSQQGRWQDTGGGNPLSEPIVEDSVQDLGGSPLDLTGHWVKRAVGIGPDDWAAAKRILGSCLFEQKWLDLTCGELADQVTVMCLPHGQLLQELRRRNASAFNRLHGLYSDCLWTLDRCVASVLEGRRERKQAEEDWTKKLEKTCADYEAKIKAIHDSRGFEEQEQARAKREAKAHVDRMGDTLRTLNGIFKTMQADGKAMTEVDLKDRCRSLEQELASRREEMQELRRLKEKHLETEAEMEQVKLELQKTKLEAVKIKEEMERRQSLVKELMDNEAKRLTEIETLKAGTDRVGGGDEDDGEGDEREGDHPRDEKASVKNRNKRRHKETNGGSSGTGGSNEKSKKSGGESGKAASDDDDDDEQEVGSSVLCIKCRKALDDLSNIADALEKERQLKGQTRLQCHGYRLLLPNLKGYRPPRTVAWVRTVMRAILRAKIWDDSVLRYKQDLRVRFPEFTYAWFEPPRAVMAAANANVRSKLVAQADDDRWGLYYGVKSLARESAEATLFWHALNESNGEDYLTFLVYCLAIVEGTAGSMLRDQWGVSATCTDLHTLQRQVQEAQAVKERSASKVGSAIGTGAGSVTLRGADRGDEKEQLEPMASGTDVVWLRSSDARETVDHILVKALEDQKRRVLDATRAISVSCEGRLTDQDPSSTCVDLFLFLRILLHSFKEEQVNRRAAVRLMFETASTGVLTDGTPIYGDGRVDQSALAAAETVYNSLLNESKAVVDLPQFMVIARTLWPEVTTSDAVAVFRDAHEDTNGEVDYQAFLKLADRWQFFSNALQLPVHMPSRADLGEEMDAATRSNLGALVHRHYNLMKPAMDTVKQTMPESAVKQLVKCQRAVERELNDAYTVTQDSSTGSQSSKSRKRESGSSGEDGALEPTPALSTTSMDGTRPLAAYRRLLAILYHIRNVRHESGPGYETVPGKGTNVVQKTEAEFRALETVFFDLHIDRRFQTYDRIRTRLAVMKVQRTWRKILARACEVPLGLLDLMRPGYLRGVGGIVTRAVHHPPFWVQQQISEMYTAKLRILASMGTTGSGIAGSDAGEGSALGGLDVTAMMGDGPKPIKELFPVTLQDPRTGRQYWHESPAVTEAVAKELFDKCSQPPPVEKGPGGGGGSGGGGGGPARARVSGVQMSLGKLMGHPAITGGREKRVDVDDALWLFMRHWLVVRQHRISLVDRALGQVAPAPSSAASAAAGNDAAQAASPSPLVSVDGFRVVTTRLENMSRSAPPRGVADLVYVDAFMVASSLSRRPENKAMSHRESTKTALLSSPVLLWDASGARREQQMPPLFSNRAMRSWLLSSWARYSDPIKAEVLVMLEELQHVSDTTPANGITQEPTGVESAAADLPAGEAPAHTPTGARGSGGSAARPANVEAAKLVRALEKIRSEVNRLDGYMKDLDTFHKEDSMAQSTAVVIPKEASAEQQEQQEQTLSPEIVKKLSRPGEVERASKEMRSVMMILAAVYRRMRPNDPRDFVQDSWASGRRTSLRRTSFNSY